MNKTLTLILLFGILTAGCSGREGNGGNPVSSPPDGTTEPIESTSGTQSSTPPVPRTGLPQRMILQDCTSWSASTESLPQAIVPGNPPQGWEDDDDPTTSPLGAVSMKGFACDRFALAGFERPLKLIMEFHGHANYPESCSQDLTPVYTRGILNSIWVEDEEVATYLKETLGMPAYYSVISESIDDGVAAKVHRWSWGLADQTSEISIIDDGGSGAQPDDGALRLFWQRGPGIGQLEIVDDYTGPIFGDRQAYGQFKPPMLLATFLPEGVFTGPANWYPSLQADGEFTFYRDLFCKEPA